MFLKLLFFFSRTRVKQIIDCEEETVEIEDENKFNDIYKTLNEFLCK